MNDRIIRDLDPTQYLNDKLNLYIEAFISYYGEEYREFIENKLNNIFIIAYQHDIDFTFQIIFNFLSAKQDFLPRRAFIPQFSAECFRRRRLDPQMEIHLLFAEIQCYKCIEPGQQKGIRYLHFLCSCYSNCHGTVA